MLCVCRHCVSLIVFDSAHHSSHTHYSHIFVVFVISLCRSYDICRFSVVRRSLAGPTGVAFFYCALLQPPVAHKLCGP